MRILRLELFGFKRLALNNIRHFVYTPTSPYQLILGTNGSGKSSILSELSPLPAHASNFEKNGYKKVTLEDHGRTFQLDSDFKTGKHSFWLEGENLNPGGTGEVQKTLVQQYFKITKEIHELMSGEVKLTDMGPTERRRWITMCSRADYTYAMNKFKQFAGKARDQSGAMKHLKSRLLVETNNLQHLTQESGLEERAHKLREEMNQLMLERIPNMPTLQAQQTRLRQLYTQLSQWCKEYFQSITYQPKGKQYQGVEDIQMDLQRLDSGIQANQAVLDRMGSEYNEVEAMLNSVQVEAGESLEDLPRLISDTMQEIADLREKSFTFAHLMDPNEVHRDWLAVRDEVMGTFRQLPDNTNRAYTRETMQKASEAIHHYQQQIDIGANKISSMRQKLAHLEEAKQTQCPSCNYVWREGYSEQEVVDLNTWIAQHTLGVETAREEIKKATAFLEECEGYTGLYQRFRGFVSGYPRLQPLWDHILSHSMLLNNPQGNLQVFINWENDLGQHVRIDAATRRLRRYEEVHERHNAIGDAAHFTRRIRTLQDEIQQSTSQVMAQREEHKQIQKYMSRVGQIHSILADMERAHHEIQRIEDQLIDSLRNQVIDETVDAHQLEMGAITRKISEKEGQEGIVRDLQNSLQEVSSDAQALQLIVQALSPNEGLIAEQLAGDIGCLVAQINSIIASVWTYEMKVLSCGMDSAELDYKFPVSFEVAGYQSTDVSKTSKGQMQMFNMAFQLTVMMYLELTDYPLFMDEPGEGFDEQHRINLMSFVKQLMDMNQYSQLFMVSHYASSHGSFTNAEVLVLNDTNISVPGVYNQHVVLA